MYLPTFWKLVNEHRLHGIKKAVPWVIPITIGGKSNNAYITSIYNTNSSNKFS